MSKLAWILARFMWMPISTAPQNRKLIVSYSPYGRSVVTMAKYYAAGTLDASDHHDTDDEFAPADWYEEAWENEDLRALTKDPTHWRRVPNALRRTSALSSNQRHPSQPDTGDASK